MINVGINGFGRIGRAIFRINDKNPQFRVTCINDIDSDVNNHAYLLKYDSTYGRCSAHVEASAEAHEMYVDGRCIHFHSQKDMVDVPWAKHDVDVIIDSSGVFQNVVSGRKLVADKSVRKVIVTHSPESGVDLTLVFGVNEHLYKPAKHHVLSSSICDVNAAAPVLSLLEKNFGVESGYITTLHPWLSYQNLVDGSVRSISSPGHYWKDYSLGRASTSSLIPKNTTLGKALKPVLPSVADRLETMSFRIPTGIVSASDMCLTLKKNVSAEEVNALFKMAAKQNSRIVGYEEEHLVSMDFMKIEQSLFVDGRWTRCNGGRTIKLVLWYDNEWGYSNRVVDMVTFLAKQFELAATTTNGSKKSVAVHS